MRPARALLALLVVASCATESEETMQPTLRGNVGNIQNLVLEGPQVSLVDVHTRGGHPELISLNANWQVDPRNYNASDGEIVGVLYWGADGDGEHSQGGAGTMAEIDCALGISLSLIASQLRFSAKFRRVLGGNPVNDDLTTPVLMGAFAGLGPVSQPRSPQRTLITQAPIGGPLSGYPGVTYWAIPAFTKSLRVMMVGTAYNDLSPQALLVFQSAMSGAVVGNHVVLTGVPDEIPVPSDAGIMYLEWTGGNSIMAHRIICDLAL